MVAIASLLTRTIDSGHCLAFLCSFSFFLECSTSIFHRRLPYVSADWTQPKDWKSNWKDWVMVTHRIIYKIYGKKTISDQFSSVNFSDCYAFSSVSIFQLLFFLFVGRVYSHSFRIVMRFRQKNEKKMFGSVLYIVFETYFCHRSICVLYPFASLHIFVSLWCKLHSAKPSIVCGVMWEAESEKRFSL